jgi:hypothetical protein
MASAGKQNLLVKTYKTALSKRSPEGRVADRFAHFSGLNVWTILL